MSGSVYIIHAKGTDFYKIGFTENDPEERRQKLQTGNAHKLEVMTSFPGTLEDERLLHKKLNQFREQGEWFKLSVHDLVKWVVAENRKSPDKTKYIFDESPSKWYKRLVERGLVRPEACEWNEKSDLFSTLPFNKNEMLYGQKCFSTCVYYEIIETNEKDQYRVNPNLSEEGFEYFMEFAEEA